MIEKFKKALAKLLIAALLLFYVLQPVAIFAEEEEIVDPTPTPTEAQTEIDNTAAAETNVVTDSNTGENEIVDPTPTPVTEPDETTDLTSASPTPTPEPEINNSEEENTTTATEEPAVFDSSCQQEEEQNQEEQKEENKDNEDSSSIETGDAVSTTIVENDVNSVSVNSEVKYQVINIIYDQEEDVDLSDPIAIAAKALGEKPNDEVITVKATGISNFAYVSNDIITTANTGENNISTSSGGANIDTGDAYATTLLLNKVNFISINSVIHAVIINIFGNINGNIILPDIQTNDTTCDTCGVSILADNNAVVENNVETTANTGENGIVTSSGSANIDTGDALSLVDNVNLVNSNYIGVGIQTLYINTYGEWNGEFIGWGAIGPQLAGGSLDINYISSANGNGTNDSCNLCTGDMYLKNDAVVLNNISSLANTGGNLINSEDDSSIKTGNAYSTVSILNFVNTNIINSFGFFGFINIFGRLNGNIGGKAEFEALAAEDNTDNNENNKTDENILASNSLDTSYLRENGGKLEVEQTNNVGEYVLPGDTVTFFINVKNTGSGKVYETKLALFLIKDGVNVGGTEFDLGVIEPGKMVRVSTGLVLSSNTPGGQYVARAYAIGKAGEEEDDVSSFADSTFKVFGVYAPVEEVLGEKTKDIPPVLGVSTNTGGINGGINSMAAFFAFIILLELYILLRVLRQKEKIRQIFAHGMPLTARLTALKMFLL